MPLAPKITYEIADGDLDKATTEVHVPSGKTVAQYEDFAAQHAESIEGMILGVISPVARLTIPVDISAITGNTLIDTSDVEQVASFQFADDNNEPVNINIPGRNDLDVAAGTDVLNESDVQIAAFITLIENGDGTIEPCSIAEGDIVDHFYARKMTKNSGRKR